jgi:hypothetical protein
MSILKVDTINEKTSGNGVHIAGHVIQVVQGTSTTYATSPTVNTYVDTGLTATITPKFSSSKVLILHHAAVLYLNNQDAIIRLLRGSTNIHHLNMYSTVTDYCMTTAAFQFLDSPSTTSATTYKTQYYTNQGTLLYNYANEVTSTATLTLMEIAQ